MESNQNENNEILGSLKLLKSSEVAQLLGISRSSAYNLMQRGDIPTVRFGGLVRVRECDLEEFVRRSWSGWKPG